MKLSRKYRSGLMSKRLVAALIAAGFAVSPALIHHAHAQAPEAAPAAATSSDVKIDPEAEKVIDSMAKWYESTDAATVRLTSVNRVEIQGMPRQQTTYMDLVLERPNKASINIEAGKGGVINTDGKTMSVFVPPTNRWVAMDAPDTFKELMATEVLNGMAPLANSVLNLFVEDVRASLLEDTHAIEYKGETSIDEIPVHHLIFKQKPLDIDVYIATGEKPEVIRIAPNPEQHLALIREQSPEAPVTGVEIQFNYSNWAFSDDIEDKAFAFTPPPGVPEAKSMRAALGMEPTDPRMLEQEEAPNFQLPMLGGGNMTLADHEGKDVVVLDFWATWCGPCVRAMPGLNELASELGDQNVVVYAVNQREDASKINPFLKQHGFDSLKVALDSQGLAASKYMVRGIPQTVVIDKQGVVRAVHVGYSPALKEELLKEIKPLLTEETDG